MNHLAPALCRASDQRHCRTPIGVSVASPSPTTVFIVDNHPAISEALSSTMADAEGVQTIGSARTVRETFAFLDKHAPDVVVMDISLADGSGLPLIRRIRSGTSGAQVLIYSLYEEEMYAGEALRAGARGFVPKSDPTGTILTAIRTVDGGDVYLSENIRSEIVGAALRRETYVTNPTDHLTERELTVFKMMGSDQNVGEIASVLDLSRKTVETYRRRAKEKLGYETVDELLRFAVLWKEWN